MSNTGPDDDRNVLRERVRAALAAGLLPLGRLAAVVEARDWATVFDLRPTNCA
jgi:hypothetical protein